MQPLPINHIILIIICGLFLIIVFIAYFTIISEVRKFLKKIITSENISKDLKHKADKLGGSTTIYSYVILFLLTVAFILIAFFYRMYSPLPSLF